MFSASAVVHYFTYQDFIGYYHFLILINYLIYSYFCACFEGDKATVWRQSRIKTTPGLKSSRKSQNLREKVLICVFSAQIFMCVFLSLFSWLRSTGSVRNPVGFPSFSFIFLLPPRPVEADDVSHSNCSRLSQPECFSVWLPLLAFSVHSWLTRGQNASLCCVRLI